MTPGLISPADTPALTIDGAGVPVSTLVPQLPCPMASAFLGSTLFLSLWLLLLL